MNRSVRIVQLELCYLATDYVINLAQCNLEPELLAIRTVVAETEGVFNRIVPPFERISLKHIVRLNSRPLLGCPTLFENGPAYLDEFLIDLEHRTFPYQSVCDYRQTAQPVFVHVLPVTSVVNPFPEKSSTSSSRQPSLRPLADSY